MAQVIAWHQDRAADVDLLLQCLVLDPQQATRARLALRRTGAFVEVPDTAAAVVARAAQYADREGFEAPSSPNLEAAVRRLPYWAQRTGDDIIDTAHLLLACLEAVTSGDAGTGEFVAVRATMRDVIRAAMAERHFTSPADRQRVGAAPILSAARPGRPTAYQYAETPPNPALLKPRNYTWRTWTVGSEHANSFLIVRLVRLQVGLIMAQLLARLCAAGAVLYAFLEVDARCALAVLPLLASAKWFPPITRLAADTGLIALCLVWQSPWWLPVIILALHGIEHLESRLAALLVRSDVADPAVTVRDLRADWRANVGTVLIHRLQA